MWWAVFAAKFVQKGEVPMGLKFQFGGNQWSVRAGGPPMGSRERTDSPFLDALKAAHPPLSKMTRHEITSWIVARLNFITSGSLELEGRTFAHDTNEFGYKIKLSDQSDNTLAHGAVVFRADRTYFASLDIKIDDFRSVFVGLLTDSPLDLAKCEITVREPESKKKRTYGWNGYSLASW
jgi:hypothetical protein